MKAAADRSLPPPQVINCIWPRIRCVTWFQIMFKCIQAGLCSICVHPFHLLERQDDSIVNINTVHFSSYVGGMQFACKPKTFTKFDYCPIVTKWLLLAVKVKILTRVLVKMSYNGSVVYDFVTDVCMSASLQCLSLDISLCIFLTGCIWIILPCSYLCNGVVINWSMWAAEGLRFQVGGNTKQSVLSNGIWYISNRLRLESKETEVSLFSVYPFENWIIRTRAEVNVLRKCDSPTQTDPKLEPAIQSKCISWKCKVVLLVTRGAFLIISHECVCTVIYLTHMVNDFYTKHYSRFVLNN